MRSFILTLVMLGLGLGALTGCSSDEPKSINGTYMSNVNDNRFTVMVSDDEMQITIGNQSTVALYWKGSVPAGDPEKFTSDADRAALDMSLMGSQDSTKDFKYDGDSISFKFTIMGMTQTIKAKRSTEEN